MEKTMAKTLYPQMNQYIIDAVENGSLIIFIGAGVSALYGYPTWDGLAKKLLDQCESENKITKSQKAVLLSDSFDPMKRVTIACDKLGDNSNGLKHVRDILGKEVEGEDKINKLNEISRYLAAYNCPIITTNADLSLDNTDAFKNRLILHSFIDWNENYDDLSLIHLHGSIKEPENMIFTSQEYAKAYRANDDLQFGGKLFRLLKEDRTILFIGYGLEEFMLIQYFISDTSRIIPNRFLLKGYLEKDKLAEEFDREYYKSLGIELISFSREKKGYDALISVLKKWNKTIKYETLAHRRIKDIINHRCSEEPNQQSIELLEGLLNG